MSSVAFFFLLLTNNLKIRHFLSPHLVLECTFCVYECSSWLNVSQCFDINLKCTPANTQITQHKSINTEQRKRGENWKALMIHLNFEDEMPKKTKFRKCSKCKKGNQIERTTWRARIFSRHKKNGFSLWKLVCVLMVARAPQRKRESVKNMWNGNEETKQFKKKKKNYNDGWRCSRNDVWFQPNGRASPSKVRASNINRNKTYSWMNTNVVSENKRA